MQLLVNQLEPLTEQQLVGITNLQQSSQQAEDALSQGMDALQQSLAETLSSGSLGSSGSSGNVANYMGQMAMAMGKLGTLEGFIRQVIPYSSFLYLFNFALITRATLNTQTLVVVVKLLIMIITYKYKKANNNGPTSCFVSFLKMRGRKFDS